MLSFSYNTYDTKVVEAKESNTLKFDTKLYIIKAGILGG